MKLITALYDIKDRDYGMMLENLKLSALKLAYDLQVYSLPSDPIEDYKNKGLYRISCFFKPHIILNALDTIHDNVLWIDCDCLLKERVDELLDGSDITFTLRRKTTRDIYDGYINAGVMAFRNNNNSRTFIDRWIKELSNGRADQDAINRLLLKRSNLSEYSEIVDIDGIQIKIVSCDTYNFFYFPEQNSAKIYHIKGHLREEFYNACAYEVLGDKAQFIGGQNGR
jgi:hypothetical protein